MGRLVMLAGLAGAGAAQVVSAAVTSAVGNNADQVFYADGTSVYVGQAELRVGSTGNTTTQNSAAILVFQLPPLPAGEQVTSAELTVTAIGGSDWRALFNKSLDLYGLRVASVPTVVAGDYFTGAWGADATEATGIEESFLVQPNSVNAGFDTTLLGAHSTDETGDANLGSWLNAIYTSDASAAGKYAFLRVNGRGDISSSARYWALASMNNATVANRPTLTLTTGLVPEPGALAILGGALVMLQVRRRAK